jgi:spore coat protein A, manganese oxidase
MGAKETGRANSATGYLIGEVGRFCRLWERRAAMTSRRLSRMEFLGIGAGAAAGVTLAGSGMATFLTKEAQAASPRLTPFADTLPIPSVLTGAIQSLTTDQSTHRFHRDLPKSTVWGYNDGVKKKSGYLGPTIEIQRNSTTTVNFKNNLPDTHLLPVNRAIAGELGTAPRILTHMHGGFVAGTSDGNPYATQKEYARGQTQTVTYTPHPRATMLWYHDHAMGMTRLNVYAGLAALVRIRDNYDTGTEPNPLGIPGGKYEVPIVLQDKSFSADGRLFYSDTRAWIPEFFGDKPVVNGVVQPYLKVEPRMYRLTFLNGSQARFYHLRLSNGRSFYQIGSEGGMFDKPVRVSSILLLPAERADVIVDFTGLGGRDIVLENLPLPDGVVSPATPKLPNLMQFRVRGPVTSKPPYPTQIPKALAGGSMARVGGPIAKKRYITLEEVLDDAGDPRWLQMNGHRFEDRDAAGERIVDETPTEDTIEDWSFVNISADTHPIHMHLTNFQVMGRAPPDGGRYAAALAAARKGQGRYPLLPNNTIDPTPFLLGPEIPPPRNERGWKDTVAANPNEVTRIRQMFELPEGAEGSPPDSPQRRYVYHCHILEHEDNDMMRPYDVV